MAADEVSLDKIYPYIAPYSSRWTIGHDAHVDLVLDAGPMCFPLTDEALAAAGLTVDAAREAAVENLARYVRTCEIAGFEGPGGQPFLVWPEEWLAAACLLLPDLHAFASGPLGTGDICACIPHRDAMLLFPRGTPRSRRAMVDLIREKEAAGRKPITMELFAVTPDGAYPLEGPAPAAGTSPPPWFARA